jgi:hypothetical protein
MSIVVVTPCSHVGGYTSYLKMGAIRCPETFISSCKAAWCHKAEDESRQFASMLNVMDNT